MPPLWRPLRIARRANGASRGAEAALLAAAVYPDIKAVVAWVRQQIEQAVSQARRSIADFVGPLSRQFIDLLFRGR